MIYFRKLSSSLKSACAVIVNPPTMPPSVPRIWTPPWNLRVKTRQKFWQRKPFWARKSLWRDLVGAESSMLTRKGCDLIISFQTFLHLAIFQDKTFFIENPCFSFMCRATLVYAWAQRKHWIIHLVCGGGGCI